jgi:hypothetical protein
MTADQAASCEGATRLSALEAPGAVRVSAVKEPAV